MWVIILLLSYAFACPVARDKLISCIETRIDLNNDKMLTALEFDTFLSSATCINRVLYRYITGQKIMEMCDVNRDGVLTLDDWTSPQGCIRTPENVNLICKLCKNCGINL